MLNTIKTLSDSSKDLFVDIASLIDWPAAVVVNGDEVLARNAHWLRFFGHASESDAPKNIADEFCDFVHTEELFKQGPRWSGVFHISRATSLPQHGHEPRHIEVRWHRLQTDLELPSPVLMVVKAGREETTSPLIRAAHQQIDQLLIRQTLIQESERRHLGMDLHDVVLQDLAHLRSMLLAKDLSTCHIEQAIKLIDGVIKSVRSLTFELSPPVLADLGLCPALEWLAEHMSEEYGAHITVAKGSNEPRLTPESRTIVFRAVRELVLNAAKHIKGATVVIRCEGDDRSTRISVTDTGPGFEIKTVPGESRFARTYGLLSVEQQIRGIGGLFSLVSSVRDGTHALITIDATPQKGN